MAERVAEQSSSQELGKVGRKNVCFPSIFQFIPSRAPSLMAIITPYSGQVTNFQPFWHNFSYHSSGNQNEANPLVSELGLWFSKPNEAMTISILLLKQLRRT
jgi:hypothetical protein